MSIFIFFIIATLLLGSVYLGPASVRVWITVLMLLLLLYQSVSKKKRAFNSLNTTAPVLYVLFLFSMLISLTFNGEIGEYGFFRKVLAYYFVCFVSYFAVGFYVTDKNSAKSLLITLILIATFNNFIAILQFNNNSIGWTIGNYFSDVSSREDFMDSHSDIIGFSVIPGVLGDPVMSGFVTAIFAPLLFFKDKKNKSIIPIIIQVILIGINLYGCFITQQRNAFILFLFSCLIIIMKYIKQHPFISIIGGLFILASLGYISIVLESYEWGRLFSLENDIRIRLWRQAVQFIQEHPFLGGPVSFQKQASLSAHNLFLDSWIFSGIGGFVFLSILWIWSMYYAVKYMVLGLMSKVSHLTFLLAIATFNMMLYGLFHNTSYLNGYNVIFIVLAFFLCSIRIDKTQQITV